MNPLKSNHWGHWVRSRAFAVGFRNQQLLAASVGCNENQISRWVNMNVPQKNMRKGFDEALCRELKTDMQTLFNDYVNVAPESAPIVPATPTLVDEVSLRNEISAAVERLSGPCLQALTFTTRALLSAMAA